MPLVCGRGTELGRVQWSQPARVALHSSLCSHKRSLPPPLGCAVFVIAVQIPCYPLVDPPPPAFSPPAPILPPWKAAAGGRGSVAGSGKGNLPSVHK